MLDDLEWNMSPMQSQTGKEVESDKFANKFQQTCQTCHTCQVAQNLRPPTKLVPRETRRYSFPDLARVSPNQRMRKTIGLPRLFFHDSGEDSKCWFEEKPVSANSAMALQEFTLSFTRLDNLVLSFFQPIGLYEGIGLKIQ
jgi:hypothetical protein